jgi:hypothetical protein
VRRFLCLVALAAAAAAQAGTWEEEEKTIAACFAAMDRDPALAVVNAKFARRDPTPVQRTDTSVVTQAEAEALRARAAKTRPCRELRLDAVRRHHPHIEPAYAILYYQTDQVFQYLREGLVTYGTANALSADAFAKFKARETAYFAAPDETQRSALANGWSEELQRAHSNPPPWNAPAACAWEGLNIACR